MTSSDITELMESKTRYRHSSSGNRQKNGKNVKNATQSKQKTTEKQTCRGQKDKPRNLSLLREPKKRKSDMEQSREFHCIYCNDLKKRKRKVIKEAR